MKPHLYLLLLLISIFVLIPLSLSANTEVYVPLGSANAVAVIDADSDKIIDEIAGINNSHGVAISKDGQIIFAGSLLERKKGTAVVKPHGISDEEHAAHHPKDNKSVISQSTNNNIGTAYVIDAKKRRVMRHIDVPGAVHHALIIPNGRFAVLTHLGRGSISVININTHKVLKELPTGPVPNYAVSKRDSSRIYVSNSGNNTVSEIDTTNWTVLRDIPAGKSPEHIVLSPDEQYLYVINTASSHVSRIDLNEGQVTQTYNVGRDPHGLDLSDDGRTLYASSKHDNKLIAFNLKNNSKREISLSPAPYHITTIHGTGKIYVSSRNSAKIWVIDQQTLKVKSEIKIRGEGHEMGISNF